MAEYLIRGSLDSGDNLIYTAGSGELELLGFSLLRLAAGASYSTQTNGTEMGIVILSGVGSLIIDGQEYADLGGRTSVFAGQATGAFVPPGSSVEVRAASDLEMALCTAASESGGPPQIITPDQVQVKEVGNWNWRRQVHDIIGTNVPQAQRLVIGETFNLPGNWSSYPPHKHEQDNYPFEVKMEEIYHYRTNPPAGFGIQRIYTADHSVDKTYTVENEDTVLIPHGYHPVAAAPGYQLYYLWMLAGFTDRRMTPRDDPQHAWVKAAGEMATGMGF